MDISNKTKSALKTGLMAVAAFSALFCAIILAFPSATAKMLGADGALEPYCASYIEGMTPFVVPAACFYFFDYALKLIIDLIEVPIRIISDESCDEISVTGDLKGHGGIFTDQFMIFIPS